MYEEGSMVERPRPFTLRLSEGMERWLERESKRNRLSKGALLESLAEESIRMRRFPGIAFRGPETNRRAWLMGTGFDVWEVVEAFEELGRDGILSQSNLSEHRLDLALAYYATYPSEIAGAVEENREPVDYWRERYPGLKVHVREF